jgi:hypothetical protein
MTTNRTKAKAPSEKAEPKSVPPWRVSVVPVSELEATFNAWEAEGYAIDDWQEMDSEPITGHGRFLVFAKLREEETPEPCPACDGSGYV